MIYNDIILSKSFVDSYRIRVGKYPTKKELLELIKKSQRVQKAERYKTLDGKNYKSLSIFWNIEKKVVIYVDDLKKIPVALSIIGQIQRKRSYSNSNYIEMTMH